MNACREWEQVIVEVVDGHRATDRARALERHLAVCEGCRRAVEQQTWLKQTLSELPREQAPAFLTRRIRDHVRVGVRRRALARVACRVSIAVAAAVLVAVVWWNASDPFSTRTLTLDEPTVAQAIVQEYVGASSNSGFSDPSLQMLAREAQMQTLRMESSAQ